ncbi:hypothetical protein FNH22_15540 [Fulvivirga sp. M361]|uniref:hypothetical protein n=1 Tax=Fulvivirga sp. M361 TaxID=2594266 RepID=UPI00117AA8A6|nr:hypothetical protein [Fulvivirga sp. M361]TRX57554.1 hypothetical protein FNH22_15540 [Fulvivirga sp. M361]
MKSLSDTILIIHIIAGVIALAVAPIAMVVKKGGQSHKRWGLIFFWSMTVIFVTALFLSTVKWIPFLLMISVFSYYSVFSAYRWKFQKKLHRGDTVKWYDWLAAIVNAIFNTTYVAWGIYLIFIDVQGAFPYLSIGFGTLGLLLSKKNIQLFLKPHEAQAWLYRHIGGMIGGFIAALTAFSSQVMGFLPTWLQWSWPSLIGVPLIYIFIVRLKRKIDQSKAVS